MVDIKFGQEVVWGTSEAGTLSYGKILSADSKSTAKKFEQEDENGELYSMVIYDQREEATVEVLANTTAVKPAIGAELTIAGVTDMIVMDSSVKWATAQTKKFSITLMKPTA
jgi:hypothetical protein